MTRLHSTIAGCASLLFLSVACASPPDTELSQAPILQGKSSSPRSETEQANISAPPLEPLTYDPRVSLAPMLERVSPAVVSIKASSTGRAATLPSQRRGIFGPFGGEPRERSSGIGSGFVLSPDGLVATNHHVVDGHDIFEVKLKDGTIYSGKTIGTDPLTDLALIQLEGASGLPVTQFAAPESTKIGDWVVAVGSPLGLEQTATIGIVSAKGRGSMGLYRRSYLDFIQTDASISPGSSGGPLFNLRGEVVGVNTAISGSGRGIGFAIPVRQASSVVDALRTQGEVVRGWLGISGRDVVPVTGKRPLPGATVGQVYADTPAARSGLQAGDRIVRINSNGIENFSDFRGRIAEFKPETTIKLTIKRDTQTLELDVSLDKRPGSGTLNKLEREQAMREQRDPSIQRRSLYNTDKPTLGIEIKKSTDGLLVVGIRQGSLAEELGLKKGDILRQVNDTTIQSPADVATGLKKHQRRVQVKVRRGDETHSLSLSLR